MDHSPVADRSLFNSLFRPPTDTRAALLVDSASLPLVKGSTIDYSTELIGSAFKIRNNPQSKDAGCGCGVSESCSACLIPRGRWRVGVRRCVHCSVRGMTDLAFADRLGAQGYLDGPFATRNRFKTNLQYLEVLRAHCQRRADA